MSLRFLPLSKSISQLGQVNELFSDSNSLRIAARSVNKEKKLFDIIIGQNTLGYYEFSYLFSC